MMHILYQLCGAVSSDFLPPQVSKFNKPLHYGMVKRVFRSQLVVLVVSTAWLFTNESVWAQGQSHDVVAADGSVLTCNLPLLIGTPGVRVLPPGRPPTHMSLMATRYWDMEYTLAGMQSLHVPLIAVEGNAFGPSAAVDDAGGYYFIPALALLFRIPLARFIDIFYGGLVAASFIAGVLGFFRLFKGSLARAICSAGLLILALAAFKISDVYTFFFATAVISVPWLLVMIRRGGRSRLWLFYFIVLGVLIGIANAIRSYSGTATLLFACGMVLFQLTAEKQRKVLLLLYLGVGLFAPKLLVSRAVAQRDAFLQAQCPGYNAQSARHVVWHAVYLGLGYLQNDFGIRWNDTLSYEKVQSVAPGTAFGSPEYEHILRQQVFLILRQHPWFVCLTVASKVGVILFVFLLSANLGLIAAMVRRKPWPIEISFVVAMAFDSLFALVVYPMPQYMLGLASFGLLYGITSLGFFLEPTAFVSEAKLSFGAARRAAVA